MVHEHRIGIGVLIRGVRDIPAFLTFTSNSPEKYNPPLHRNRPSRPIEGRSERVKRARWHGNKTDRSSIVDDEVKLRLGASD